MKIQDPRDITIRTIPKFPSKGHAVKTLPGWHGKKVKITIDVSLLDRARLLAHETITYSKWAVLLIRLAVRTVQIIQSLNTKDSLMIKVLKVAGRVVKMIGTAVGAGGWALSFIAPEVGAIIAGASFIVGDAIVLVGDIVDDGKLNSSFSLHDEKTAKAVK